jgi:hypothetical protein
MSHPITARKLFSVTGAVVVAGAAALGLLLPCQASAQATAVAAPQSPGVGRHGDFETGNFSEFDGSPSVREGTLVPVLGNAVSGHWSAFGSYDGSGNNGFSRVMWSVTYESGDTIRYGASYYLYAPLPCWAMLARWDNYALYGHRGDVGGVELEGGVIRLVRADYAGTNYARLSPDAPVPLGRWFSIEVVQRLGNRDAANEFYVDGKLVGSSTTPNSRGLPIRHIRFGYVAVASWCTPASSFFIDRVFTT